MKSMRIQKTLFLQKLCFSSNSRALPILGFDTILTENRPRKKEIHPFNALYPWKSKIELADYLENSILLNTGEIVVINKPYGLPIKAPREDAQENWTRTLGGAGISPYHLEEILPILAAKLGVPHLNLVKSAEKYMSGPIIATTSDKASEIVRRNLTLAKAAKTFSFSYLALTLGIPKPYSSNVKQYGLSIATAEGFDGKQPILKKDFSVSAIKRGDVKLVRAKHSTLSSTSLRPKQNPLEAVSLVEICSSTEKHHALRILMTKTLSPILGDHIHGNRVQAILNVPMNIGPFNVGATGVHKVPDSVIQSLNIRSRTILPTFLHRSSVRFVRLASNLPYLDNLPNVQVEGDDVIIKAPLPSHFVYACEKLGLRYDF